MAALAPYKRLTQKTFRQRRERLGLSGEQMARLCGASSGRVIRKWEAGDNEVPQGVSLFLWVLDGMTSGQKEAVIRLLVDDPRG